MKNKIVSSKVYYNVKRLASFFYRYRIFFYTEDVAIINYDNCSVYKKPIEKNRYQIFREIVPKHFYILRNIPELLKARQKGPRRTIIFLSS